MTIAIESLSKVDHILVHDNCADGTASAIILKLVFPEAQISFCQYGTEWVNTLVPKAGQLFCDFTPPATRAQEFLEAGAIVLDHHGGVAKTITEMFQAKGQGVFEGAPGVSGAVLAYKHVFQIIKSTDPVVQDFAEMIGLYDTWQKNHESWGKACEYTEAVRFWELRFLSTKLSDWSSLLEIGKVLVGQREEGAKKAVSKGLVHTTGKGRKVLITQAVSKQINLASDVASDTLGVDLSIGFSYLFEDGVEKVVCSVRSRGDFNCRHFVTAFGGGGHQNAAGFSKILDNQTPHPYLFLKGVLETYERVEDLWLEVVMAEGFEEKVKNGEIEPAQRFLEITNQQNRV